MSWGPFLLKIRLHGQIILTASWIPHGDLAHAAHAPSAPLAEPDGGRVPRAHVCSEKRVRHPQRLPSAPPATHTQALSNSGHLQPLHFQVRSLLRSCGYDLGDTVQPITQVQASDRLAVATLLGMACE